MQIIIQAYDWEKWNMIIKNGRVIDTKTGKVKVMDIRVEGSHIAAMGSLTNQEEEDVIEAEGLVVAPGLIDVHVHFRDPGFTYKEDILTGAKAAAKGGYTTVVCMANTRPAVDNEETLRYVIGEGKKTKIHVLSTVCVTEGLQGKKLTDIEYLTKCGAAGITDDGTPIIDEKLLRQAMLIAKEMNIPISLHEEDPRLITDNGINAGSVANYFGMTGSPAEAESLLVKRDLMIAEETGARLNIQHISAGQTVEYIRQAKKRQFGKEASIYAEVTPHHFSLTEEDVRKYGTLAKMNPPLRTEEDRQAIIRGLQDDTIDLIATDHAPHSAEEKAKPIAEAPSGIIGLETALALGITNLVREGYLTLAQLIRKMTLNPANLYRLEAGYIEVGAVADLTIFSESEQWTVQKFVSKSINSPFIGKTLFGKVKYTICEGKILYQE